MVDVLAQDFFACIDEQGRMVKKFMQLSGNRISATRPGAHGCGSRQTIRRFDPPPRETESRFPSLGGSVRCENAGCNLKARAGARPRRIRSFSTGIPLLPTDSTAPHTRSSLGCGAAGGWAGFPRIRGFHRRRHKTSHRDRAADNGNPDRLATGAVPQILQRARDPLVVF